MLQLKPMMVSSLANSSVAAESFLLQLVFGPSRCFGLITMRLCSKTCGAESAKLVLLRLKTLTQFTVSKPRKSAKQTKHLKKLSWKVSRYRNFLSFLHHNFVKTSSSLKSKCKRCDIVMSFITKLFFSISTETKHCFLFVQSRVNERFSWAVHFWTPSFVAKNRSSTLLESLTKYFKRECFEQNFTLGTVIKVLALAQDAQARMSRRDKKCLAHLTYRHNLAALVAKPNYKQNDFAATNTECRGKNWLTALTIKNFFSQQLLFRAASTKGSLQKTKYLPWLWYRNYILFIFLRILNPCPFNLRQNFLIEEVGCDKKGLI